MVCNTGEIFIPDSIVVYCLCGLPTTNYFVEAGSSREVNVFSCCGHFIITFFFVCLSACGILLPKDDLMDRSSTQEMRLFWTRKNCLFFVFVGGG